MIEVSLQDPVIPAHWHSLLVRWRSESHHIQEGLPQIRLAPSWQLLLLSDGSTTRHLQLLTGEPIEVDLIEMSEIGCDRDHAPNLIDEIEAPRLRRQVWLRTQSGERLAYATSWWEANQVDEYLRNRAQPVWASLAELRTELYRDIREVVYGDSRSLEQEFGDKGPFWGRYYIFWHNQRPLTLIHEIFSPKINQYIDLKA